MRQKQWETFTSISARYLIITYNMRLRKKIKDFCWIMILCLLIV